MGVVFVPTNVWSVFSHTTVGLVVIDAVGISFTLTTCVTFTALQPGVDTLKVTVLIPPVLHVTVWEPSVLAVAGEPAAKSQV